MSESAPDAEADSGSVPFHQKLRQECRLQPSEPGDLAVDAIDHIVVLMLENRSFDHLFGLSGLAPQPDPATGFTAGGADRLKADLPHEYDDVHDQVASGAMNGFKKSGGVDAMRGVPPVLIPNLFALANNYLLMDNWYSSMPGPTWPNRYYAHAGSSGGLVNSLVGLDPALAVKFGSRCLHFENGTIFDRLRDAGKSWRVYRGDPTPQVLSLPNMVDLAGAQHGGQFFRPLDQLAADSKSGDLANYTWIEPAYDALHSFKSGNSHHPLGALSDGDNLIGMVYKALRAAPDWNNTVLLITWDEHGGFFDAAPPPSAVPPGDKPLNYDRGDTNQNDCNFDRYGVRVPAVLISPRLPRGLGSKVFPRAVFDHASIVATLRENFGLGGALTARDGKAPSWNYALQKSANATTLALPKVSKAVLNTAQAAPATVAAVPGVGGSIVGFAQIALDVDAQIAVQTGQLPLANSVHKKALDRASTVLAQTRPTARALAATHRDLLRFIADVHVKANAHESAVLKARKRASAALTKTKPRRAVRRTPLPG